MAGLPQEEDVDDAATRTISAGIDSLLDPLVNTPWEKQQLRDILAWTATRQIDFNDETWMYCSPCSSTDFKWFASRRFRFVWPILLACNGDVGYSSPDHDSRTMLHAYFYSFHEHRLTNDEGDHSYTGPTSATIVESLIARGASLNAVDKHGRTVYHVAAMAHDFEAVDSMLTLDDLQTSAASIDARDEDGNSALHLLLTHRRRPIDEARLAATARALLARGADPHAKNEAGVAPLHAAASRCSVDLLRYFADSAATDFDLLTGCGDNALLHAYKFAAGRHGSEYRDGGEAILRLTKYLLGQGHPRDVNHANADGETILHVAARRDTDVAVRLVREFGADVDRQTRSKGWTGLHCAVVEHPCRCSGKATGLMCAGADLGALDREALTPLASALLASDEDGLYDFCCLVKCAPVGMINEPATRWRVRQIKSDKRLRMILRGVLALKLLGLPVDESYGSLIDAHLDERDVIAADFSREVEALKARRLLGDEESLSIYQFVHMHWRRQSALVDRVLPVLEDLKRECRCYDRAVRCICARAARRARLFGPAKLAFCRVVAPMPDICLEGILDCLDNWSLKLVIDAADLGLPIEDNDERIITQSPCNKRKILLRQEKPSLRSTENHLVVKEISKYFTPEGIEKFVNDCIVTTIQN